MIALGDSVIVKKVCAEKSGGIIIP